MSQNARDRRSRLNGRPLAGRGMNTEMGRRDKLFGAWMEGAIQGPAVLPALADTPGHVPGRLSGAGPPRIDGSQSRQRRQLSTLCGTVTSCQCSGVGATTLDKSWWLESNRGTSTKIAIGNRL